MMTDPIRGILTAILPCLLVFGCTAGRSEFAVGSLNIVPLVTTFDDGVIDSQVIPVRVADGEAWLALDTGAPFTFLFSDTAGPEYVENAGTVEIGCEKWQVPGYRDEAIGEEMFQGKPIVGVLGLDFFLYVPAEIDYPNNRLVRHLDGKLPADNNKFSRVPLRGRENARALIDVVLDGINMTLMFDTGAHDTILIGAPGGENDELTQVQTADGRKCDVHLGKATLSLPGEEPRTIPVMRALDFPYVAPELREIHAHGLFGLTSLGWRCVVFDFDDGALRLGPLHNAQSGKAIQADVVADRR
ncbi:MAG: hypothetical protein ABIK28_22820 [Planctomycetota bacterium]